MTRITPPMASAPYFALAAPRMISMRSMFSAPMRSSSSPLPLYFASPPSTRCPSTRISVCLGSAPRIDTPTLPIASMVRVTPTSLKITSSTDFACLRAMSSAVMIVVDCDSYFASSFTASASTCISAVDTLLSPCTALSAQTVYAGRANHVATAKESVCRNEGVRRVLCFIRGSSFAAQSPLDNMIRVKMIIYFDSIVK